MLTGSKFLLLYPVYHWYEAHKTYFSTEGERGLIYLKRTNYTLQLPAIETLVTRLQAETGLIKHIDAWPVKFKVTIETRASKEGLRRFHNHIETAYCS